MDHDTIVVGAGPGGASAAFFLSRAGQRVLLLERTRFPRHKPCGGAVPVSTFRRFPFSLEAVIETRPTVAEFRYPGQSPLHEPLPDRPIALVRRPDFDALLLSRAADAGAQVLENTTAAAVVEHADGVEVSASDGRSFAARYLVGADGANSGVARALGLRQQRVLGGALEAEVQPDAATMARLAGRALFVFGACPGGYLWVFARREHLSVGVARLAPGRVDLKSILLREMDRLDIDLTGARLHGHPLPLHRRWERLHSYRCLLVGDAAGLVEPLLGEGVRFALYSGQMAADTILGGDLARYTWQIQRAIGRQLWWAGQAAWVLYAFPMLAWRLGLSNPRLRQGMVDVLRQRCSYRRFVWRLPFYLLASAARRGFQATNQFPDSGHLPV